MSEVSEQFKKLSEAKMTDHEVYALFGKNQKIGEGKVRFSLVAGEWNKQVAKVQALYQELMEELRVLGEIGISYEAEELQ